MLATRLTQQLPIQRILYTASRCHRLHAHRPAIHRQLTRCNSSGEVVSVQTSVTGMRAPTGVTLPSLYDANNRQQQLGPRGVETFFVNKQGLKIASYFWPSEAPKNTKAVVLAIHGHGAHIQNEYLKRQVFCVMDFYLPTA